MRVVQLAESLAQSARSGTRLRGSFESSARISSSEYWRLSSGSKGEATPPDLH